MKLKLIGLALIFPLLGLSYLARQATRPYFLTEQVVSFDIPNGSFVLEVARSFQEKGASASPLFFRVLWFLKGQPVIKAGHYEISPNTSLWQLFDILSKGQVHWVRVSLPEGSTLKQIGDRLQKAGVIDSCDEFLRLARDKEFLGSLNLDFTLSAEGFLFPDTYIFDRGTQERKVLKHMVETFWKELKAILPQLETWDKQRLYDRVKLASLVEKEYRVPSEAPLIASVFENRLLKDMRLESCATLVYIITEIEGKEHPERILWRDVALESVYNTYKYKGLPPTPIANSGRVALKAAFSPAKTDYFYFVVKDPLQGTHTFTANFHEHSQARKTYLESYMVK